jgi:chorismate synthase
MYDRKCSTARTSAVPIVEAIAALVLADHALRQKALRGAETVSHYKYSLLSNVREYNCSTGILMST